MTSIPEISARGSLILWADTREGKKCRPLDHIRQLPFFHQLCWHPILRSFSLYINLFQIFIQCRTYFVSWNILHLLFTHALLQDHLFQGSAPFWSYFVLCVVRIGTKYRLRLKHYTDALQYAAGAVNVLILWVYEGKRCKAHADCLSVERFSTSRTIRNLEGINRRHLIILSYHWLYLVIIEWFAIRYLWRTFG